MMACSSAVWGQSTQSNGAPLEEATRQLAERLASVPGIRGPFHLEFFQDPAVASESNKEWQSIFRQELEKRHLTLTEDQNATALRVGVGQTPTQMIFSACVRVGDKDEVRFVTLPRASVHTANQPVVPVRIEKQLVYESVNRIVDASSLWNAAEPALILLVYQGSELTVQRLDGTGKLDSSVSLAAAAIRPSRDLRAELLLHAEDASVIFAGKSCQLSLAVAGAAEPKCHTAKPAWRGAAVLTPSCDAGSWRLQADGADWSSSDLLQVVPADSSHKGSAGMFSDFPGPILSMAGEQNPASALVVTRNLRTGIYEVYRITLVCGN
jgi:hypothetical protein